MKKVLIALTACFLLFVVIGKYAGTGEIDKAPGEKTQGLTTIKSPTVSYAGPGKVKLDWVDSRGKQSFIVSYSDADAPWFKEGVSDSVTIQSTTASGEWTVIRMGAIAHDDSTCPIENVTSTFYEGDTFMYRSIDPSGKPCMGYMEK